MSDQKFDFNGSQIYIALGQILIWEFEEKYI